MMRPGIEPRSPGALANTLPTRPMGRDIINNLTDLSKEGCMLKKTVFLFYSILTGNNAKFNILSIFFIMFIN